MISLRNTLVGLTGAALLATPAGAAALAPTGSAPATATTATSAAAQPPASAQSAAAFEAARRYNTWVRFLRFDHTRPWAGRVVIRGQVAARVDGERGALRRVRVQLYRQLDGRTKWVRLDTRGTGRQSRPKFRFEVRAKANADYRVIFRGNRRFQPSRKITQVSVHRVFNARLRDGTGRFRGRVQPNYGNRRIVLEKRSCPDCGWNRARVNRTGDAGRWRFKVGAPSSGRWWWRVTTTGSTAYMRSSSAVFTTELN